MYRRITALLSVAILTFAFAIAGTAFAIGNNMRPHAHDPAATPLFNESGVINGMQANAIIGNLSGNSITDRMQEYRLFSDVGTANSDIGRLSRMTWRMVHFDASSITFWAASQYRTSPFRSGGDSLADGHQYSQSTLRSNLLGDFDAIVNEWAVTTRNAHILTLSRTDSYAVATDRMFVPSFDDIFAIGASGRNWGITNPAERGPLGTWSRTPAQTAQTINFPGLWRTYGGNVCWVCSQCNHVVYTQVVPNHHGWAPDDIPIGGVHVRETRYDMCQNCSTMRLLNVRHTILSRGSNTSTTLTPFTQTAQTRRLLEGSNNWSVVSSSAGVRPAIRLSRQAIVDGMGNNVTFDPNGGTTVTTPVLVPVNQPATEPSTTRPGYTLLHWENTATNTPWNFATNVTAPLTLRAIWTANTGPVNFSLNGGTGTPPAQFTATTGGTWPSNITVPTDIARIAHILIGFGTAPSEGQMVFNSIGQRVADPPTLIMLEGGITLYAMWVPIGGDGTMGLAETVSEAHQLRLTRSNFPNETTWQRFNVALRQAEWALWNLHNLTSGQVAAMAGELRTAMDARS